MKRYINTVCVFWRLLSQKIRWKIGKKRKIKEYLKNIIPTVPPSPGAPRLKGKKEKNKFAKKINSAFRLQSLHTFTILHTPFEENSVPAKEGSFF